jgi:hypothetical protein
MGTKFSNIKNGKSYIMKIYKKNWILNVI